MPRNVRNFWVEVDVDGRESTVATGPKNSQGGIDIDLYQRADGEVTTALKIRCVERNGELTTYVKDSKDNIIFEYKTQR
jgi:hypothetical protein